MVLEDSDFSVVEFSGRGLYSIFRVATGNGYGK